ncbi:hypothetical protein HXX01_05085 [Candidatus Nomurabacteria bacterium]|nr:hypothetical protein [Candidatus Nomurabacteria bacterium]
MKTLLTLTILALITLGCSNKQKPKDGKLIETDSGLKTEKLFKEVATFPIIKDSSHFITELRQTFGLEVHESPVQKENEKITAFKKIRLYGSDKDYFFIEYDWKVGSMAEFPWKYQLLLTNDGNLVKTFSGQRFDFVTVFLYQNPFLLTLTSSAIGNGGHQLYKISGDTLENVYEGYYNYGLRTFDAHQDNRIYEPNELTLKVKDFNNDGFNDICFKGKIVLIQGQTKNGKWFDSETIKGRTITYSVENPFKKIPVEFIFLYDRNTRHFTAKENYSEKYELDN